MLYYFLKVGYLLKLMPPKVILLKSICMDGIHELVPFILDFIYIL